MKSSKVLIIGYCLAAMTGTMALSVLSNKAADGFVPSVKSLAPSGTHAFERLLRELGVQTVIDTETRPILGKDDLGIVFYWPYPEDYYLRKSRVYGDLNMDFLKMRLHRGGTLIVANFDVSLEGEFDPPAPVKVRREGMGSAKLGAKPMQVSADSNMLLGTLEPDALPLWSTVPDPGGNGKAEMVELIPHGAGIIVNIRDGIGMTNKVIDEQDNAAFYVRLIKSLMKPGGRVVILEAGARPGTNTTFAAAVGPWAETAWRQFEILCILIAITLGTAFGKRIRETVPTAGTRDLLNAFGYLLERSNRSFLATELLQKEINNRKRSLRGGQQGKTKTLDVLIEDAKKDEKISLSHWNEILEELTELERKGQPKGPRA